MKQVVRNLPRDDDSCGWLHDLPGRPTQKLNGEIQADIAILGSGFTGLAAARHLAAIRPGWRIALIDAQRAGHGASGRSSGFLVDIATSALKAPPAQAKAMIELGRFGLALLRDQHEILKIDCHWDDTGWLRATPDEGKVRTLDKIAAGLETFGVKGVRYGPEEMAERIGTSYYRAGFRIPGSPLVHSGRLVEGLAATLPESVELYEESPISRIERRSDEWMLVGPEGLVRAPRLIVAVNSGMASLGIASRQVFPLITFGSLTRHLTDSELALLGNESEWGLLSIEQLGSTLRKTRDQRLLVRNRAHFQRSLAANPAATEKAIISHRRALAARYPDLASIEFESSWGGVMAISPSNDVFFGQVGPQAWAAGGYTAAGIVMGTTCGHLLAEEAAGETSAQLQAMKSLPQPKNQPPQPFLDWGIRLETGRLQWRAGTVV